MSKSASSFSRRKFLAAAGATGAGMALAGGSLAAAALAPVPAVVPGQQRVFGLRFPPMAKVRVGFVGVGNRGTSLLNDLLAIDGVQITALCDVVPERVQAAQRKIAGLGRPEPAAYTAGDTDYQRLCQRDDVDLVYIATPWDSHTPIAVAALRQGKHAAIEVPAALTLEECWQLVDTAEQTRRHCLMLENCCYGELELLVLRMARQGVFGELTHAEAGYLHEARDYLMKDVDSANWRRSFVRRLNGNLYPTHGLGPVAEYLGIHAGDRFERLVSLSSLEQSLSRRRGALPSDSPLQHERYACGDINTTLLQTALGRTVMLQFSMVLSRPYSRINSLAGTAGTFRDYPPRLHLDGQPDGWVTDLKPYHDRHGHPLWHRVGDAARQSGGHGGMDYVMNWRLIQCLREGLPLDLTVYDAACWSSLVPLTIASVAQGGAPVTVPDFTRGAWQRQPPGALAAL